MSEHISYRRPSQTRSACIYLDFAQESYVGSRFHLLKPRRPSPSWRWRPAASALFDTAAAGSSAVPHPAPRLQEQLVQRSQRPTPDSPSAQRPAVAGLGAAPANWSGAGDWTSASGAANIRRVRRSCSDLGLGSWGSGLEPRQLVGSISFIRHFRASSSFYRLPVLGKRVG